MKIFTRCWMLVIIFTPAVAFSQNAVGSADTIAGNFIKTLRRDDKERVILQTDRKVYAAGEQIWFKAFLVRALNNRIDTISKTLFTDLVDDNDKTVSHLVLNAAEYRTAGMLNLADTLHSGYYWLRCYTKRMVQEDTESIFVQPVYIVNPRKPEALSTENLTIAQPGDAVVEFFPEGGSIITGINSAGAVRVMDDDGDPIVTTGYIANQKDSVVANFATNKFGLARVSFYPIWFDKYKIVVTHNGHTLTLPLRTFDGYATRLAVVKQSDYLITAAVALEDSIYSRSYVSFVLGLSKDSLCFVGVGRGMYQVDIPTANFPGGIATLLLFDDKQHILSERKVFINKDNYTLNIQADKPIYAERDMAKLGLTLTDGQGHPLIGSLNIAIDDDKVARMSEELESDTLQPGSLSLNDWLLQQKQKIGMDNIDLFMLAQDAEYKTRLTLAAQEQPYNDADSSIQFLRGKIIDRHNKPQNRHVVSVLSKNTNATFFDVDTTKADGSFRLNVPYNVDSLKLLVKVTDRFGVLQHDRIELEAFKFPSFTTPLFIKKRFTTTNITAKQQLRRFHIDSVFIGTGREWLKPVVVKTKAKPPLNYIQQKRESSFSTIFSSDQIEARHINNLANLMYSLPGFAIIGGKVTFYGLSSFGGVSNEPLLVVDGVEITTDTASAIIPFDKSPLLQALSTIDPRTVDFVEVLSGSDASIYGVRGGHGVVSIHTKTQPTALGYNGTDIAEITPVTYHTPPVFPMPDYSQRWLRNDKSPDKRNTVFWATNLFTGADGKAAVNFYTSDGTTPYTVTISGITSKGDYIYKRIKLDRK